MIQNYVQLNSILFSEAATMIIGICFLILIFVAGFFLGRAMRIKKLEDKWDKKLAEYQEAINEILEKAGMPQRIGLKRED